MHEPPFTFHDVVRMADPGSFNRGESYYRQGRVLNLRHDPSIDTYFARVAGSSRNLYEVELCWTDEVLQSSCTCPVEFECKHGVAVALRVLAEPPPDTRENPDDWQQWLSGMPDTERPASARMPPGRHYLRYDLAPTSRGFRIQLRKGYLKQDGSWSQPQERLQHAFVPGLPWREGCPAGTPSVSLASKAGSDTDGKRSNHAACGPNSPVMAT